MKEGIKHYTSTGLKSVMFTLRTEICFSDAEGNLNISDRYMRNLSIDLEKAKAKAEEIIGKDIDVRVDHENGRVTGGQRSANGEVFNFGKHLGKHYTNPKIEESYLIWLFENPTSPYTIKACGKLRENVKALLIERDLLVEDSELGLISKRYFEYRQEIKRKTEEAKATSKYIGSIKEKIELELTLDKVIELGYFYNVLNILFLLSDKEGNKFTIKSTKCLFNKEDIGKTFKTKAKVLEHIEYKEIKQTRLGYVRLIK